MCKYTLPKIWMGRIQKYWDRLLPSNIPVSGSTFSTSFKSDEAAAAVAKMEDEINTENCIALDKLPENTYISDYVGVYDVEAVPGELTLLCPEPVSSNNVIVLHYNEEADSWDVIEDIQIINGYVWGTLESFSPIAVFEYARDIEVRTEHVEGLDKKYNTFVIANGNTIKVYAEEDKIYFVGPNGEPHELTDMTCIIGGSVDGTPIKNTNVMIVGVKNKDIVEKVCAGSVFVPTEEIPFTTVESQTVKVVDCELGVVCGSVGAVRVNDANIIVENTTLKTIGDGHSWLPDLAKDINAVEPSFADLYWVKNAKFTLDNVTATLFFMGGNSGFTYTNNSVATVKNSTIEYCTTGGSNGRTDSANLTLVNSKVNVFQSANRGNVNRSVAKIDKCEIENLYVGGEATDSTVTGCTGSLKYDITTGTYHILAGSNGGKEITTADIVESVKVSRSAEVEIDSEFEAMLGFKYVVK